MLHLKSILSHVPAIGLTTSQLLPFQDTPPSPHPTYKWFVVEMETFWHLVGANLASFQFSLFSFFIPLYISKSAVGLLIKLCKVFSIRYSLLSKECLLSVCILEFTSKKILFLFLCFISFISSLFFLAPSLSHPFFPCLSFLHLLSFLLSPDLSFSSFLYLFCCSV